MQTVWKRFSNLVLGCLVLSFSGCATMQTIGDSLAFWKKSPPKDQFASNLTKPSAKFNTTGTGDQGTNAMALNPSAGSVFQSGSTTQPGNATGGASSYSQGSMNPNTAPQTFAGNTSGSARSPYSGQIPSSGTANASYGSNDGFSSQPVARSASATSKPGYSNPANNSFLPSTQAGFNSNAPGSPSQNSPANNSTFSTTSAATNGFSPSATSNSQTSQFSSQSAGFGGGGATTPTQPSGSYSPNAYVPSGNSPSVSSPNLTPKTQPSAADNWKNYPATNYPSTDYPGFGSTSAPQPPRDSTNSRDTGNVPASANMTPPPSLPSTVFQKQGRYAPGSTGNSGTASQAGFETQNDLYSPSTGSKIPTTSGGLYTPQ